MSITQQNRLNYLLTQLTTNQVTRPEFDELFTLLKDPEKETAVKAELLNSLQQDAYAEIDRTKLDEILQPIFWQSKSKQERKSFTIAQKGKDTQLIIKKWAVAASILLLVGWGTYFLFFNKKAPQPALVQNQEARFKNDVKAPENNKATITLANGQKIYLDSAVNGELMQEGNIKLVKLANGQIVYRTAAGKIIQEIKYNTLFNPRGSKVIDMTLADGSRVWLNAGSSVTYPIAFVSNERKVTITGEAYFEVAHNNAQPFIVSKGEMKVQVLGTKFNVNAYDDERDIKVTLLEGSIKVAAVKSKRSMIIKPGQQVQVTSGTALNRTDNANLEEVMAWKNGNFYFDGADIKSIMRQLEKWYDIEVEYRTDIAYSFVAKIARDVQVSEMLKLLEMTEGVHFKIEGKKIVVMK